MKHGTILFFSIFAVRVLLMLTQQSYFVADEYWQSVEVAHRVVFGYGFLTWEWKEGIRSFIFPSIFIYLFKLLKILNIDTPLIIRLAPRLLMCVIQSFQDMFVYKQGGKIALFTFLFLWPTSYIGTRTLSNTLESLLFILLYKYKSPVFLVVVAFWIRPTTIFASIFFFNFKKDFNLRNIIIGILSVTLCCLYDAIFYYSLGLDIPLCTPFNFFKRNILDSVAIFYGSQPFLFYFYSCIPSLLGPLTLLLPKCTKDKFFKFSMLYTLFISFISHKEIRYLYPILPFLVLSVSKHQSKGFFWFNITLHLVAIVFFGQFHQVSQGKITSMISRNPMETLFLMPCHSTPFYSHIHSNVTLKFLECPNKGYSETKAFIDDPLSFVSNINKTWQQIVTYQSYADIITPWLKDQNYTRVYSEFNTFFFIDDINASHISVYQKNM